MAILKSTERIPVSDHFFLDEFVPETIYRAFGKKSIIFVRKKMVLIAEAFRGIYGPTIINSWATRADGLNDCGYRTPDSATGSEYSQHKFKSALDLHFVKFNGQGKPAYDQVRSDILDDQARFLEIGITTIEADTHSWLHIDDRWTMGLVKEGSIYVVPYK